GAVHQRAGVAGREPPAGLAATVGRRPRHPRLRRTVGLAGGDAAGRALAPWAGGRTRLRGGDAPPQDDPEPRRPAPSRPTRLMETARPATEADVDRLV